MTKVYIIEDDPIMAECLALAVAQATARAATVQIFADAVTAMAQIDIELPALILLDVMLSGPDGFTFLNELMSYHDTAKIPIVIVSSLDLSQQDLSHYGVVKVLDKATMTPDHISAAVRLVLEGDTHAD